MVLRLMYVLLLYIYYESSKSSFIDDLYVALKLIAVHSLVGYICGFFLLPYLVPLSDRLPIRTFNNIFFYENSVHLIFDIEFIRSQGVFWEPGVLQVYLNLLLFLSTYIKKKVKYQVLSVILIITTSSTTGLILLTIQVVFMLIYREEQKNLKLFLSILSIILFSIPIIYLAKVNVEDKFEGSGVQSTHSRIYDFHQAINLISIYPITGIGIDPYVYLTLSNKYGFIYESEWLTDAIREMRGNTNDVLMIFVKYGIPLGLLYYYLLFRGLVVKEKKILFFIIITVSNLAESLMIGNFFLYFVVSGVCSLFGTSAKNRVPSHSVNQVSLGLNLGVKRLETTHRRH